MADLKEGDRVPDVRLKSGSGSSWLGDELGTRTVALYFYPKDYTPGCTIEACGFRDAYEGFVEAGAVVIGVSADSDATHATFRERYKLPFKLLSDPDGRAAELFGVRRTLGLLPGRTTFVIDCKGVVRYRFDSQLRVNDHVKKALEVVRQLEVRAPA